MKAIEMARAYLKNSYAPYSGVRVAAVAVTKDGELYPGVNVENASYGLTVCAERVAIFRAVTEGHRDIEAVVVVSNQDELTYPCGACLQVMSEFGVENVVLVSAKGEVKIYRLSELMPHPFRLSSRSMSLDK